MWVWRMVVYAGWFGLVAFGAAQRVGFCWRDVLGCIGGRFVKSFDCAFVCLLRVALNLRSNLGVGLVGEFLWVSALP